MYTFHSLAIECIHSTVLAIECTHSMVIYIQCNIYKEHNSLVSQVIDEESEYEEK